MKLKYTILTALVLLGIESLHAQTISGLLTTTLGEVPYGVENFTGYIISNDDTEQYPLTFYADGRFEATGISTDIDDTQEKATTFTYEVNGSTLLIKGSIDKGLNQSNIQSAVYSLSGQKLAAEFIYEAQSGAITVKATAVNHQLVIANINNTYQLKIPLVSDANSNSNKGSIKAQLKATTATLFDVVVNDPNGNLANKVFDANLEVNSNSFIGELQYAKNATKNMAIRRSDGNLVENVPIIFSYNNDPDKRITIWITSVPQVIEVDLNIVGTNPTYEITNGFEDASLSNPNIPFKSTTGTTTFIPGTNSEGVYDVEKLQDQMIIIQYENAKDTMTLIPGTIIEATYLDDNNRVETYTADDNGNVFLERHRDGDRVMIKVFSSDDYYGHSAAYDPIITYNLVTKESEENFLIKGRLTSRRYLPDGTPIPAVEIAKMFYGPALTAHNDKQNVYYNSDYTLDKAIAEERYANLDNWFGTNWNIVDTNNNPTREELEANFPNNTYQDRLTNTIASGSPVTTYQTMTLPNGKNIVAYGTMTDTGAEGSFYKEHMRSLGIYASDRNTGIMQMTGGTQPDEWELQIIPAILEYQKTFVNNYNKTLKNLID